MSALHVLNTLADFERQLRHHFSVSGEELQTLMQPLAELGRRKLLQQVEELQSQLQRLDEKLLERGWRRPAAEQPPTPPVADSSAPPAEVPVEQPAASPAASPAAPSLQSETFDLRSQQAVEPPARAAAPPTFAMDVRETAPPAPAVVAAPAWGEMPARAPAASPTPPASSAGAVAGSDASSADAEPERFIDNRPLPRKTAAALLMEEDREAFDAGLLPER